MNEEQRARLAGIRQEQQALRAAMERLEARIDRLLEPEPALIPAEVVAAEMPPPIPYPPTPSPPPIPSVSAAAPPLPAEAPKETLEVRLGAKWFVRIAVFMLVAALAFLANYLYQNVVPHLGPGAKVGLLYLGAGAIAGLGAWLERSPRWRDNAGVVNYARVVLAGGLAAVYYVTYAAHHYDRLRVIGSPFLAGLLLLGWTAFMTWLAERRRSQTLAAFSILLAYFAAATSNVVGFTLVSNLGLTAAAVFLVLRQRWTAFSFASLASTYGSYAFWRYGDWFWIGSVPGYAAGSGLWTEGAFLGCYWALFTVAAFLDRQETFGLPGSRASFASLNNGAFFGLVGVLVHDQAPGSFWKWALALGFVLLALGEMGRRTPRPLDPPTVDSYHFGGISLVTLGLILYYSGWQLSVILAVESATVLASACRRRSWPLFVAAAAVASICALAAAGQVTGVGGREHWLPASICGAILVFNAWQCRRFQDRRADGGEGLYSLLNLGVWFLLLEVQITQEVWRAPTFAAAAVALTAGLHALRIRSAVAIAQFYLVGAYWHWLTAYADVPRSAAPRCGIPSHFWPPR